MYIQNGQWIKEKNSMSDTKLVSMRLRTTTREQLANLSEVWGVSQADVVAITVGFWVQFDAGASLRVWQDVREIEKAIEMLQSLSQRLSTRKYVDIKDMNSLKNVMGMDIGAKQLVPPRKRSKKTSPSGEEDNP
jgi:hypothetical protein